MRFAIVATLAAAAVTACDIDTGFGSGPPPPPERLIQLEVDWPLARTEGFIDARWILSALNGTEEDSIEEIGPSGRFVLEFITACYEGEATGRGVLVSGRFASAPHYWSDCTLPVPHKCVRGTQRVEVQSPPKSHTRVCSKPDDS